MTAFTILILKVVVCGVCLTRRTFSCRREMSRVYTWGDCLLLNQTQSFPHELFYFIFNFCPSVTVFWGLPQINSHLVPVFTKKKKKTSFFFFSQQQSIKQLAIHWASGCYIWLLSVLSQFGHNIKDVSHPMKFLQSLVQTYIENHMSTTVVYFFYPFDGLSLGALEPSKHSQTHLVSHQFSPRNSSLT